MGLIEILFLLMIYYLWEYQKHQQNLKKIPIRIHVNGTRGKSSVTRLIYAGLKQAKLKVVAKTTGSQARLIGNGGEIPVPRLQNKANIIEQLWVVKQAVHQQAQVLVIECMALQPELQALSELQIIQSTHGVLTNIRQDHLDVMGPTERDVGLALLGTIPKNGILFSAEQDYQSMIQACVQDRGSQYLSVQQMEIDQIDQSILNAFPYEEHAENIALALLVCESLGISREIALLGMQQAPADIGVLKSLDYFHPITQQKITLLSAFAANDPESTGMIWEKQRIKANKQACHLILMNCRADRFDRTLQLAQATKHWHKADYYVAMGEGAMRFKKILLDLQVVSSEAEIWVYESPRLPFDLISEFCQRVHTQELMILGIGNIKGIGLELIEFFEQTKRGI